MSLCPSKVEQILRAAYVLHNYLATTPDATGARHNVDDSNKMPPLERNRSSSTRSTLDSRNVRDESYYCITQGQLSFRGKWKIWLEENVGIKHSYVTS